MPSKLPTQPDWLELYEASLRVKAIAPWTWMTETDVFGVQNPETDELGFISVMGMNGEHFAISLYLGAKGLYNFWDFEEAGHLGSPDRLLEIPQLQASFEDRDELHNQDRDTIKTLGLKFRGKKAWPMFRSFRPGCMPWFMEPAEVRFMAHALNQLADVAPRFQADKDLFEFEDPECYLVRVPNSKSGDRWQDQRISVSPPASESLELSMDFALLEHLKKMKPSKHHMEVDLCMFPAPVREGGDRPYFPYVLIMVETQSGMVLGMEMLQPLPSLQSMWGKVPMHLAQQFAKAKIVPQEIAVCSPLVFQLLQALAQSLKITLNPRLSLPVLNQVKGFMFQRFG